MSENNHVDTEVGGLPIGAVDLSPGMSSASASSAQPSFTSSVYAKSGQDVSGSGYAPPVADHKPTPAERQRGRLKIMFKTSFSQHLGFILKFLTLTSCDGMKMKLHDALNIFRHRIRRLTYGDFREVSPYTNKPYMDIPKMQHIYGADVIYRMDDFVPFEYGGVRTCENAPVYDGEPAGVYHFLCYADYIPFQWLQDNWFDITGAHRVNIQEVKETRRGINDPNKLANYILCQYVYNQNTKDKETAIVHSSHSRGFVSKGYSKVWDLLKSSIKSQLRLLGHVDFFRNSDYLNVLLHHWNEILRGHPIIIHRYFQIRTWGDLPQNEPETRFYLITPDFKIYQIATFFDKVEASEIECLYAILDSGDLELLKNDAVFHFPEGVTSSLFTDGFMLSPDEWSAYSKLPLSVPVSLREPILALIQRLTSQTLSGGALIDDVTENIPGSESVIEKMLHDGVIYEPRPGLLRAM